MRAATPDAYRVDAGADTRDYPGGVATRLKERPTLPGRYSGPAAPASVDTAPTPVIRRARTHAPKPATAVEAPRPSAIAPAVERTVIAVVPPREQTAPAPAPDRDAAARATSPSEPRFPAPAAVPTATASEAAPAASTSRFAPDADLSADHFSFAPRTQEAAAREYAHFDEPVVSAFNRPQADDDEFSVNEESRGVPSRADVALSRGVSPAPRLVSVDQVYVRASQLDDRRRRDALAYGDESVGRPPLRRDRPRRKKRSRRGLGMFLLGFLLAIVLVLAGAAALYYPRFAGSHNLSSAVDACHASGSYVRLATDKSSLTLQAENEAGSGLSSPIFLCILDEPDAPAAMRQRMLLTRAIDGTQEEQWGPYRATWTYHPEQGLNVVISAR